MITLYIKTHNKTGLKYFGKTKQEDVEKYNGSGTYWRNHLKTHGYDVTTEIYAQFEEESDKLVETALKFSNENNIAESDTWANLIVENGLDGVGPTVTEDFKRKVGNFSKNKAVYIDENGQKIKLFVKDAQKRGLIAESKGRKYSDEINAKKGRSGIDNAMYGKQHSDETKQIIKENWEKSRPILICPYCMKQSRNNMKRYHFDNCKLKDKNEN